VVWVGRQSPSLVHPGQKRRGDARRRKHSAKGKAILLGGNEPVASCANIRLKKRWGEEILRGSNVVEREVVGSTVNTFQEPEKD